MIRRKIQTLLKTEKLDAAYMTHMPNIRFVSGFHGTAGSLLIAKKRGYLFTDARYRLVAKSALPSWISLIDITKGFQKPFQNILKKNRMRRIGVEYGNISHAAFRKLKRCAGSLKQKDVTEEIAELRAEKSKQELFYIAKAQKITDEIFKILKRTLKRGMSEKFIAWRIETLARELGADDISFTPIVGIGAHSASPHHHNTERKMKRGDLILLDFGVIYKGYCSDMTRVLFSAQPSSLEQKIYSIVLDAQENAESKLKSGISGMEADKIAREIIKKAGYAKCFGHSLGHGVGLEVHELPNLSEKYKKKLPENSVVTVEPGIYLPGKFGIRLEDMGIIKKNGFTLLTKSAKAMHGIKIRL